MQLKMKHRTLFTYCSQNKSYIWPTQRTTTPTFLPNSVQSRCSFIISTSNIMNQLFADRQINKHICETVSGKIPFKVAVSNNGCLTAKWRYYEQRQAPFFMEYEISRTGMNNVHNTGSSNKT